MLRLLATVCPTAEMLAILQFEIPNEWRLSRDFEYLELVGNTTQGTLLRCWLDSAGA